jgi:hypothetical protein
MRPAGVWTTENAPVARAAGALARRATAAEGTTVIVVAHRRNTLEELRATPRAHGVEIDLRSKGDDIIVQHDPFRDGEPLERWLDAYDHRLLILNTKEEGLEERLQEQMAARAIEDYFFLDQSFPFLLRTARAGDSRCAVRVSEYESVETALALQGLVEWAWIDCFTRFPLSVRDAERLSKANIKLCLVSPELQGRWNEQEIATLRSYLATENIAPAAVCTKLPDAWERPLTGSE